LVSLLLLSAFFSPLTILQTATNTNNNEWTAWKIHVKLVSLAVQHAITRDDAVALGKLAVKLQRWLLNLYGDITTPNSHWTLHLQHFVEWFGVLRAFWTFPQESILSLAKKSTKKMTNHRAVAFSCVRLFILERLLDLFLRPTATVPRRCALLFYFFSSFFSLTWTFNLEKPLREGH